MIWPGVIYGLFFCEKWNINKRLAVVEMCGSPASRVALTDTGTEVANLPTSLHFTYRRLSGVLSSYSNFYHELHEQVNITKLFRFSIRESCLFVAFVIPTHLPSHHSNPSTGHLHPRITGRAIVLPAASQGYNCEKWSLRQPPQSLLRMR